MKERLKEYISSYRMVLKRELHAKNRITANGALVVPVLRYTYAFINWRLEEIT
jgi:hypothetical protein